MNCNSTSRGLSYYTGCIFEVAAKDFQMGSIGGGGRYADLTGVFGVPGLSGVGISFGADRIYDVLEGKNLFPDALSRGTELLFATFDEKGLSFAFKTAASLRAAGIAVEVYPESGKLKKQFEYAAKRNVPYVAIIGDNEIASGQLAVKDQASGEQATYTVEDLIKKLRK
jgi:histidyl-tRNA synthetase